MNLVERQSTAASTAISVNLRPKIKDGSHSPSKSQAQAPKVVSNLNSQITSPIKATANLNSDAL